MTPQEELDSIRSIFIDTAPVIYFIEGHPTYGPISKKILEHFVNRNIQPFSSVLTLTEVLVKPVQAQNLDLARSFSDFIRSDFNFKLIDVNETIAEIAGYLRGNQQFLKTIDALQIASAIHMGAEVFLTNDEKLRRVSGIKMMFLKDYL